MHGYSLQEDQHYVIEQILSIAKKEEIDIVILAGDIYDTVQPPAWAIDLLDYLVYELSQLNIEILMISGNHDSPERLNFASRLLGEAGLHIRATHGQELEGIFFSWDTDARSAPEAADDAAGEAAKAADDAGAAGDAARAAADTSDAPGDSTAPAPTHTSFDKNSGISHKTTLRQLSQKEALSCADNKKSYLAFWLFPFMKRTECAQAYPELCANADQAPTTEQCYQFLLDKIVSSKLYSKASYNIAVLHDFVLAGKKQPETSDSERGLVGGLGSLDACLFDDFDYVAMGHIHKAQAMGKAHISYSGSPLAYSFSEANSPKSLNLLQIDEKVLSYRPIYLEPLHPVRSIEAYSSELLEQPRQDLREAYLKICFLDQFEGFKSFESFKAHYPYLMQIDFKQRQLRSQSQLKELDLEFDDMSQDLDLIESFSHFYEQQYGAQLTAYQEAVIKKLMLKAFDNESYDEDYDAGTAADAQELRGGR